MSVYSACIFSDMTIPMEHAPAALRAIQRNLGAESYFKRLNLEVCSNLGEALDLLGLDFELTKRGFENIQYSHGTDDNSSLVWPSLSPFVVDGSKVVMEHDGERETTTFSNGEYCTTVEDEDEYEDDDYDEPEEADPEIESLYSKLQKADISPEELKHTLASRSIAEFIDDYKKTPLLALLKSCADRDFDKQVDPAIIKKVHELVDTIIAAGVDVNQASKDGKTAIYCVLSGGFWSLADSLFDAGATIHHDPDHDLYERAAAEFSTELLQYLKARDPDFPQRISRALILACGDRESSKEKRKFIEHAVHTLGVDVNKNSSREVHTDRGPLKKQCTVLMAAALGGCYDIVQLLLEQGADKNAADISGNTALHYCSGQTWHARDGETCWRPGKDNLKVIDLLAEPNSIVRKNIAGKSAYMLAHKDNPEALVIFNRKLETAGIPTPIFIDETLNGEIQSTSAKGHSYLMNFRNGKFHGRQRFSNANGTPFVDIDYEDGQPHGSCIVWHDSGKPMMQGQFKAGKPAGTFNFLSETGIPLKILNFDDDGKRHGQQLIKADENQVVLEANYRHGNRHGRFYFRNPDEDKVVVDETYVQGKLERQLDGNGKDDAEPKDDNPLMGLFNALLGGLNKEELVVASMEEKLVIGDSFIFHKPEKIKVLFEKAQLDILSRQPGSGG